MLFSDRLFYGRMFFSAGGDGGGGAGSGSAAGDDGGGSGTEQGPDQRAAGGGADGKPGGDADQAKPGASEGKPSGPSANQLIKEFAAQRGVSVTDLLKQFEQAEDAGRTELQKLTKDRDQQKQRAESTAQRLRTANARVAVTEAATRANAIDSAAVVALVRDRLEFDDEGEPTNVAAVLDAARKQHPALFRAAAGSGDGSKGGLGNEPADISDAIRRATGRTARSTD